MQIHNLSESPSILNTFMSEIRDVNIQNDRMRFRRNIERIGEVATLICNMEWEVDNFKN